MQLTAHGKVVPSAGPRQLERGGARPASISHFYDPARPWNSVWTAATDDNSFWHRQFEQPALVILTRVGRLSDMITSDAPAEHGKAERSNELQPDTKKKRKDNSRPKQQQKIQRENTGVYTHIPKRAPNLGFAQQYGVLRALRNHGLSRVTSAWVKGILAPPVHLLQKSRIWRRVPAEGDVAKASETTVPESGI